MIDRQNESFPVGARDENFAAYGLIAEPIAANSQDERMTVRSAWVILVGNFFDCSFAGR